MELSLDNDVITLDNEPTKSVLKSFKVSMNYENHKYFGIVRMYGDVQLSQTKITKIIKSEEVINVFIDFGGRTEEVRLKKESQLLSARNSVNESALNTLAQAQQSTKKTPDNLSPRSPRVSNKCECSYKVDFMMKDNELLKTKMGELERQMNETKLKTQEVVGHNEHLVELVEGVEKRMFQTQSHSQKAELLEDLKKDEELQKIDKVDLSPIDDKFKILEQLIEHVKQSQCRESEKVEKVENQVDDIVKSLDVLKTEVDDQEKCTQLLIAKIEKIEQDNTLDKFERVENVKTTTEESPLMDSERHENESQLLESPNKEIEVQKYVFIFTNFKDLIGELQKLMNNVVEFWDGVRRELVPSTIIVVDGMLIRINKAVITKMFPGVPLVCASNSVTQDESIIVYQTLNTLPQILITKVVL
ncbi:hypothetical protein EIN_403550 [Entamoeba invadens IP1]|uniref:Uncharacterized protein n=1 Tax=Entamoeba invadens IP1 TaxID=370355 RepID=A0A0A1UA40_ENTIV|nr:hypothetical protein EIN_403550 [Entamoeba invadens IP1]ELP90021.1 hypothetical protein EIN_403550 [Entamoeba invadens IP1]|eukprot:XP_004256792.1 hypothetical protein EIN_403550 [Entamoeba invadens IP1]